MDAAPGADAAPPDPCPYPESLGGGGVAGECGVTAGAWYPLGGSELVVWPERATTGSAEAGLGQPGASWPRLALGPDLTASVLYSLSDCVFGVLHWDGQTWVELPEVASDPPDRCRSPLMVADGETIALAILQEAAEPVVSDDYELRVLRWNGELWEQLGGALADNWGHWIDFPDPLAMAWTPSNELLVLHVEGVEDVYSFELKRWDGAQWDPVGESFYVPGQGRQPGGGNIAVGPSGEIAVTMTGWSDDYAEETRRVSRWDGVAWTTWSDPLFKDATDLVARVHFDRDGVLYLSWSGPESITLFRLAGSAWERIEPSDDVLERLPPDVFIRTYTHALSDTSDVHVRVYERGRWRGRAASDRGGGISNSDLRSSAGSVARSAERICAAWTEELASGPRILLRCHDEP